MSGDAKATYIADPEAVSHSLAALAARAQVLGDKIDKITSEISAIEAGKPWGTAEEFGGHFEAKYQGDHGGATFIKDNVKTLAGGTSDGAIAAHRAIQRSATIDEDGAVQFTKLDPGDQGTLSTIVADIKARAARED